MIGAAQLLDRGIATAISVQPFFADGWGDPGTLAKLLDRTVAFGAPERIEITWRPGRQRIDGLHVFEGFFGSPDPRLPLPAEARTAYVQLLLPEDAFEGERPPVAVHLAGSGDATYMGRRMLAAPLARREGIGAMILQNPYYGERAPSGQPGTQVRTVADHLAMNIATIEEARSLLDWLRRDGYRYRGVTGYSMGGFMAALTAQLTSRPIAAVPCAAADSPVYTILESPLSKVYDWAALQAQIDDEGEGSARSIMAELMGNLAVSRHGSLEYPEYAVVLGATRDAFVTPRGVLELHRHWRGSECRWIDAGHTTGWALHGSEIREAIASAFERLVGGMAGAGPVSNVE